ncbi:hypothetical protein L218DRAFT_945788 [Marasmius fiardii PR-910]|nr:hypothetical protein L218DRAFT_945788 [Marasmius fiardii PR-910]
MMIDLTQKLVEDLGKQQIVSYVDAASAVLVIYEVLINLSVEIEYIWTKKWSFLTVLYVLQRYLSFFDTMGLGLQRHLGAHLNAADCMLNYQIAGWSIITGLVLSEIVLTIRVWAVWERSVSIAIGLVVLMMIYDVGALVMLLIPGFTACLRGKGSELVKTMYRDGVIFYVLTFLVSMANVVIIIYLPPMMTTTRTDLESLGALTSVIQSSDSPDSSTRLAT